MNIPRMGNKVPKLGMFSKVVPFVAILSTLVACATPPRVVNDPSIPDNGAVIIRVNDNPYQYNCGPPYRIGNYCDPYYSDWHWNRRMMDPQVEFILRSGVDNKPETQ